jgi:hypothetical protein
VVTRGRTVASLSDLKHEKVGTIRGSFMLDDLAAAGVPPSAIDGDIESGQVPAAPQVRTDHGRRRRHRGRARREGARSRAADRAVRRAPGLAGLGRAQAGRGAAAALDEYIANARRTPTWNRLAVKYFGPAAPEILRNSARK